jgi:hypothetical protein
MKQWWRQWHSLGCFRVKRPGICSFQLILRNCARNGCITIAHLSNGLLLLAKRYQESQTYIELNLICRDGSNKIEKCSISSKSWPEHVFGFDSVRRSTLLFHPTQKRSNALPALETWGTGAWKATKEMINESTVPGLRRRKAERKLESRSLRK